MNFWRLTFCVKSVKHTITYFMIFWRFEAVKLLVKREKHTTILLILDCKSDRENVWN